MNKQFRVVDLAYMAVCIVKGTAAGMLIQEQIAISAAQTAI